MTTAPRQDETINGWMSLVKYTESGLQVFPFVILPKLSFPGSGPPSVPGIGSSCLQAKKRRKQVNRPAMVIMDFVFMLKGCWAYRWGHKSTFKAPSTRNRITARENTKSKTIPTVNLRLRINRIIALPNRQTTRQFMFKANIIRVRRSFRDNCHARQTDIQMPGTQVSLASEPGRISIITRWKWRNVRFQ